MTRYTPTSRRSKRRGFKLLFGIFAEHEFADFPGGFAAIFDLERAGGFEFVEVFHDEVSNVEFEAGAFEAEAFHADFLFAQPDDEADDFAVEAGGDFVLADLADN
jgi:hypothetical protein